MEINVLFDIEEVDDSISETWLKSIVETVLTAEKARPDSEVSLVITGQQQIHELNRTYLEEDRPTDVLSFPMLPPTSETTGFVTPPDGLTHLGEVIISLPQATIQAAEHNHSIKQEIAILITHGILHLLGYDHDIAKAESDMKARETAILNMIKDL